MPKVLIFTGAPEPDWSSPDLIPAPGPSLASHSTSSSPPPPPPSAPSWRSLPLHRQPLTTGFSQPHGLPFDFPAPAPAHFFSLSLSFASQQQQDITASTASQPSSQDQLLSQFYDHSLALHHDLASSQLPPPPTPSRSGGAPTQGQQADSFDTTAGDSFVSETTDSFLDNATTTIIATPSARPALVTSHRLTDLRDVPPASDLLRLAPQTVTVNLIAGVISVSEPRPIRTRWGNELSLVEVLVGDDTRAGFCVTFWLPPDGGNGSGNGNRNAGGSDPSTPARLRRQDVILLQNVALHAFRGKVYGQSLRKGLTRTTVLYRRKLAEDDEGGYYRRRDLDAADDAAGDDGNGEETHPQLVKTKRVWEWVLRFVGGEERPNAKGKKKRGWDAPPDDTQ